MNPDHRAKLEQVARAWVDVNGLGHHPYSNEMVGSLADLLASRDVVVLEEVAEHLKTEAKRYRNDATDFMADDEAVLSYGLTVRALEANETWCRQQAQE